MVTCVVGAKSGSTQAAKRNWAVDRNHISDRFFLTSTLSSFSSLRTHQKQNVANFLFTTTANEMPSLLHTITNSIL